MGAATFKQLDSHTQPGLPDKVIEIGAKFVLIRASEGIALYRAFPSDRFTTMKLSVDPTREIVTAIGEISFPYGFDQKKAHDIVDWAVQNTDVLYDVTSGTPIDRSPAGVTIKVRRDMDEETSSDTVVSEMVRELHIMLRRIGWEIQDGLESSHVSSHTLLKHAENMLRLYGSDVPPTVQNGDNSKQLTRAQTIWH